MEGLSDRLAASLVRNSVPGASIAVLLEDRVYVGAAGLSNIATGAEVVPQTAFHIGSVTKVFTATLTMMLVNEERLQLDDRLERFLPDLVHRNPGTFGGVTIEHLLSHVSGIDGDCITNTGDAPEAVEKLVDLLAQTERLHPAGRLFSYCNVGYVILGRILEIIEEKPWDDVLCQRLLEPLGLHSVVTSSTAAGSLNVAEGYEYDTDGRAVSAGGAFFLRSNGPSGTTMAMTAPQLMAFARVLLGNRPFPGTHSLASYFEKMRERRIHTPHSSQYAGWGLGLALFRDTGQGMVGHDGAWAGRNTYLRMVPKLGLAIAIMANGGWPNRLYREMAGPILRDWANVRIPSPPAQEKVHHRDLARYEGRYRRFGQTVQLHVAGRCLLGTLSGEYVDHSPKPLSVHLSDERRASCSIDPDPDPIDVWFLDFDSSGSPDLLYLGDRIFARVSAA